MGKPRFPSTSALFKEDRDENLDTDVLIAGWEDGKSWLSVYRRKWVIGVRYVVLWMDTCRAMQQVAGA